MLNRFLTLSLVFFFILSLQASTFALSTEEKQLINGGIYWYSPTSLNCNLASGVILKGSSNHEKAYNYFLSRGLTHEQTAGILGNLEHEAPGLDPTTKQIGGGPGRGIAQWETNGRWDTLLQFASVNGWDEFALETQLEFIWFEMTGEPATTGVNGGKESKAYDKLLETNTVKDATIAFGRYYERFKASIDYHKNIGNHTEQSVYGTRINYAESFYQQYSGNSASLETGFSYTGCSESATVSIDGFYFPLATTKSALRAGSSNESGTLSWNPSCKNECHHDYDAADLFVEPGTVVIAAKDGTVIKTTDRIGGTGSNVQIRGLDGNVYYYTHMKYNSLRVEQGDEVKGGEELGEVGNSEQAVGTAPHLHFDIMPSQYEYRVSCSSEACTQYEFIDVQPILSQLYQRLPE